MPNTYGPQVVLNVPASFAVGVNTDFSIAFVAGDMAGTMVTGLANFPKGDYTVQYYEVTTKKWMDFTPSLDTDGEFGPSGGFPLMDATSYFRIKFNQAMSGTLVVKMKDVNTQEIITQSECVVTAVVGETADELNARIALGGVVRLATDVTGTLNISNDVEIIGNGHTLHGNIVFDSSSSTVPYNVTIADLNMREDSLSTSAKGFGLIGQNQSADQPVRPVNLVLRDCQITGYAKKGAYFTNSKTFSMVGCTIGDVATEPVNNPNTFGDYAIDLNLCGVTNCAVRIVDNKFTGTCGAIGAVKVTQRGGIVNNVPLTDDVNTDIKNPTSATVASCVVSGNDFSEMNATKKAGVANVVLGSSPNTDGTARTYNNSYPASVTASTAGTTDLMVRGAKDQDITFSIPAGGDVMTVGTPDGSGKYSLSVNASKGTVMTGTAGSNVSVTIDIAWEFPDKGPVGAGFNGLKRLIMKADSVDYPAGGFDVPPRFLPYAIVEASAKGGIMSWYDKANNKIVLYTANGTEASGTLTDLTIVMVGN